MQKLTLQNNFINTFCDRNVFSGKPRFNQAALDDLPFEAGGLESSQFPQPSKEDSIAIFEARNIEFLAQPKSVCPTFPELTSWV